MRRTFAVMALVIAVPAPASAWAGGTGPAETADALTRDPVYVAPARAATMSAAAQGRIRVLIAREDNGRIRIAVIPQRWTRDAGGVRAYANAVDAQLGARGALLVVADEEAHVVTSHERSDAAAAGVQRAFDAGGSLEDTLRRSVLALASVDPGEPTPGVVELRDVIDLPDVEGVVEDVTGTIRFVVLTILGTLAGCGLLAGAVIALRRRAAREEDEEVLADDRAAVEAERVALGQDIVELDAASAFAGETNAAYARALDAYERSELALARADNRRRLETARRLVAGGRRDAAAARVASE